MENQNNNNLSELDQLKAQYETLKERFEQQEIVNERLMKSSIRHSTDFYKRYRWIETILYPLVAIIGFLYIKWQFGGDLSLMLFWGSFVAVCLAMELWMTRKFRIKTLENNDLLTLSHYARNFKKLFSLYIVLSLIPAVILVLGILISKYGISAHLSNLSAFLIMLCFALLVLIGYGFFAIRYTTKPCDEIIRQIASSESLEDKKTGIDREQRWLKTAMIAVFLGLGVWSFAIVTTRMESPLKFVRAADDLSTEGKLEIWEVDADTVAISSALLGGKPMVQCVETVAPSKKSDAASVQINVVLTPEASQLWYQFTSEAKGHHAAFYLDGVQIQDLYIQCGINNGCFFIVKEWSSKEELEEFCKKLSRQ